MRSSQHPQFLLFATCAKAKALESHPIYCRVVSQGDALQSESLEDASLQDRVTIRHGMCTEALIDPTLHRGRRLSRPEVAGLCTSKKHN